MQAPPPCSLRPCVYALRGCGSGPLILTSWRPRCLPRCCPSCNICSCNLGATGISAAGATFALALPYSSTHPSTSSMARCKRQRRMITRQAAEAATLAFRGEADRGAVRCRGRRQHPARRGRQGRRPRGHGACDDQTRLSIACASWRLSPAEGARLPRPDSS